MDQGAVPKLGVGLNYQAEFLPFLDQRAGDFDFLEVVPDIFWIEQVAGGGVRYREAPDGIRFLNGIRARMPVIPHSIGLSIGSAHRFRREHVAQVARWHRWLEFPWHSDHLSFHLTGEAPGAESNAGITMPLPRDEATLELLARRIAAVQASIPVPFLLENNVYFLELAGQEMDEAEFLNTLCRRTGCGLLLDLHNVHTNSRNLGLDPAGFLDRLDLTHVVEIHIAGGFEDDGYYLDSHSGATPEPVWEMLEHVVGRAPCLGGVVFELFGSWYSELGPARLGAELHRMRTLWDRFQPAPLRTPPGPVQLWPETIEAIA